MGSDEVFSDDMFYFPRRGMCFSFSTKSSVGIKSVCACLLDSLTRPFQLSPEGRSWHSFTFVTDTRAIVYGGFSQYNTVLSK